MKDMQSLLEEAQSFGSFPALKEGDDEWPDVFPSSEPLTIDDLEFPQQTESPTDSQGMPDSMAALPGDLAELFPDLPSGNESQMDFTDFQYSEGVDGTTTFSMNEGKASSSDGESESDDQSMMLLLRQIADGIGTLTGAKAPAAGAENYQFPWAQHGFAPLEQSEDYASASPSMNVTNMNGARGAGGWGFGSKTSSPIDLLEPGRRTP